MTTVPRQLASWFSLAVFASGATAIAQDKAANYPVRPMRIIISVAPGAGADMVAKLTADVLREKWGQNVVVDPRPGGGGVIASTMAAKADPDGYTLYQNGFGLLMQGAAKRVEFDILKTFTPVAQTSSQPYILLVHPSVTAKSIKDLVAQSQAGEKPLTYAGSSGIGSTVHIGMERFAKLSGAKLRHVAYKGSAPAILALMGGEINMAASSAMAAVAAVNTGKVRALVNLGPKRVPALPDLPTLAEQGYTGVTLDNSYNLWVPAKTPRPIAEALNRVVNEGMHKPENAKQLIARGSQPGDALSLAELRKEVEQDYAQVVAAVKELGIKF